jgi:hypothetical protein
MSILWKKLAVRRLGEPDAPRAFARDDIAVWLAKGGIEPSERTLFRTLQEWETQGVLSRPAWGVYLNLQSKPLPMPEEAVGVLRPDAVISLGSVLSQAGVLNNPSYWVTAVLPSTATKGPVDIEMTDGRMLRFAYMRPDLVISPDDKDAAYALQTGTLTAKATPEKALLDWVYLSSSTRGAVRWPLPALHDLDIDDLDADRLDRLAQRMDLVEPLDQLRQAINANKPRVAMKRNPRKMR